MQPTLTITSIDEKRRQLQEKLQRALDDTRQTVAANRSMLSKLNKVAV